MKTQKLILPKQLLVVAILFFATSSTIAQVRDFNSYDADRDSMINQDEFSKMYTSSYNDYDLNKDAQITDRELYDYSFNKLDKNGDRELDSSEWQIGYDNLYSNYLKTGDYTSYDSDRNDRISKNEYYESFRNSNYFNDYDTNGDTFIDADELRARMYRDFDLNEDGLIDENEYTNNRPFYINN